MEANFLRRLEAGRSVVSVSQGINYYMGTKRVPEWMKKTAVRYLRWFLNSMDYIVVSDWALYEELLEEGISRPQICVIPADTVCGEAFTAAQWLKLYEQMWESTLPQYPCEPGYALRGSH